jgi:hypothetical protein
VAMRQSGPISLFSERQSTSPPTASLLLSILAHGAVIALVALGVIVSPRVSHPVLEPRYAVRRLDLHMPDPEKRQAQAAGVRYPGPLPAPSPAPDLAKASARPQVARQVAQATPAPQTLLQPKLPRQIIPEKVPAPTVVIWQMENKTTATIVPPLPKKTTATVVQPAVQPPNEEVNLDKLAIASSPTASKTQPILPSTTTPMVVLAPQAAPTPPETTSKSTAQPTPAAVVSLSDLRKEGVVILPPANQTASSSSSGLLAPGHPEDLAQADHGNADRGNAPGNNTAPGGANSAKDDAGKSGAGKAQGTKTGQDGKDNTVLGPALAETSNGAGTVERINLPKNGEFGAVIVGSSLEEMYPEAAELWSGRLAYTVYLHVGLAKSWILQYALPAATEAAAGGNAAHLAAPWPYTIVRPNLTLDDLNADALMVRGVVNASGRFEALAVAFPPKYAQAEFVISSLRQWEFRPATQGGHPTAVEVLLIIPGEAE